MSSLQVLKASAQQPVPKSPQQAAPGVSTSCWMQWHCAAAGWVGISRLPLTLWHFPVLDATAPLLASAACLPFSAGDAAAELMFFLYPLIQEVTQDFFCSAG